MSRQEQARATRAALIDAARELWSANGFFATSTSDIVTAAAVGTRGAFYAHFPDRDAIVAALAERGWHDVVDEIHAAAADGSDSRDRLHRGCATYVAFAQRHPLRYAMMTRAAALTPAAAEALGVVTRGLANCRAHPEQPAPAELSRIAAALSTALHGVAMLNRTDAPSMWLADVSPTEVITTLVDSAVDQLDRAEENT